MTDFVSHSAVDADKVSRSIQELVQRHVNALFDASVVGPTPTDLAEQVATGAFSPLIEQIRAPLHCLAQREGLLIQGALGLALQATLGMRVLPTVRISVTESDRDIVAGNLHGDLSELSPPRASDEVGRVEIDLLSIEPGDETFWVIDCKRAPREKDGDRRHLLEASLAAKRRLRRQGVNCRTSRICLVRWYSVGNDFGFDPAMATNKSVDQVFGAPVRAIVDAALTEFKDRVNTRFRERWARAQAMEPAPAEAVRHQPPVPVADLDALRRALTSNGRRA